ncbi:hypothetical protein VHUM_03552 [Vanrija humicola]|uniref:Nop14-like protein n=1 Tax=Vanrija humicola TaxID=5417 RepID=A0A7D8UZP1_VANHU|nr:hypothetical protein VHUM_03552 [Vanrija humicola]
MGPSQLAQLKNALNSAGLNRKSVAKKTKKGGKKGASQDVDRAKKSAKLDEIRARFNKFDERETKLKHDVGGRKIKGVTGRPTATRQAGLEQRRKTLLPEHNNRDHRGTFRDRRFGESDPSLSLEDRMLERYTRERQKGQGKKGAFNLEDDDDAFGVDGDDGWALGGLTHGGRDVDDLPGDDFDAQGFAEYDDEDTGAISRRQVHREHFGGFEDNGDDEDEERKKSKHEVMSEIISKSKEYKLERQHQKEMDSHMREELDEGLDELRALLGESVPVRPAVQLPGPQRTAAAIPDQQTDGDYDELVRTLGYEARSKPKDRTKTEDELAVEEKERLEEAEAKRQRRMRGEASDDEDQPASKKGKASSGRVPDADDLDDDFVGDVDEDGGVSLLGPGLTREAIEDMDMGSVNGDDIDSDGSDGDEEDDDEEGDEDEDDDDDDDEDEISDMEDLDDESAASDDEDDTPLAPKTKNKGKGKAVATEIPFTFPCPSTVEDFIDIVQELPDSALPTVVQRIRALHHPSLAQGNKEKLQEFLGVLLDYILVLASQDEPPFGIISALGPHLAALVKLNPLTAASHFIAKLSIMQKNLQRGLARGASNPASKTLPSAPELVILRLVGVTWSTSDFSHPVVQPAVLLIGQYLSQSRIRRVSDIASGLFLCSVISQYESMSKRLVPEVIDFLASSILALVKRKKNAAAVKAYPSQVVCDIQMTTSVAHNSPADVLSALAEADVEQNKADLLSVALRLVSTFANMYSSTDSFIELFRPLLSVLEGSRVAKLAPELQNLFDQTRSTLSRQIGFAVDARQPLTLQSHKPIPIASYTPKFEDDFAPGKHYDPDAERAASSKLRAQYKKERKGAIRELRKDNRFLAGERAKEQAEKDAEYNAKMRRAEGSINVERAEEKEMEREKKREKRRRG